MKDYCIRVAILVDGAFFLMRYKSLWKGRAGFNPKDPSRVARDLYDMVSKHATDKYLYRILYYDGKPFEGKTTHPLSGKFIDFATSEVAKFKSAFYEELTKKRKVALRLGHIKYRSQGAWAFRPMIVKELLKRKKTIDDLAEVDLYPDIHQKGVDIRIGLDIASIAYKRLVDQIVLVSGDSDFIPAAKLARREGIDVLLDPMWGNIDKKLLEHVDGVLTYAPKPPKHE